MLNYQLNQLTSRKQLSMTIKNQTANPSDSDASTLARITSNVATRERVLSDVETAVLEIEADTRNQSTRTDRQLVVLLRFLQLSRQLLESDKRALGNAPAESEMNAAQGEPTAHADSIH